MRALPALAVVLAVLLAGCAERGKEQLSNNVDSFRYSATWETKIGTNTYAWENTKGQAEVYVPQAGESGVLTVRVKDAGGTVVYQEDHVGLGSTRVRTTAGSPGAWTVELVFEAFRGQVDVSVRAVAPAASPSSSPP